MRLLSLVIPVFNEKESLRELAQQIRGAFPIQDFRFEVLFVDDGSRDGSWEVIREICAADRRFAGIRFRRNFGKSAALAEGFSRVTGDRVATLDADLQDDPREIPAMLALTEGPEKLDLVSGWKKIRNDPWHKVIPSRIFNWLISTITGVALHDHNCGLKVYRAEVVREVPIYGELHRFIPVLAAGRGFRVGEKVVAHRPRKFGASKFGAIRFLRGFLDLLTVTFLIRYSQRPQHFLGALGLLCFLGGLFAHIYLGATWVIRLWFPDAFPPLHERPLLVYALGALLLGAQLLSLGFLAEMMRANSAAHPQKPSLAEETPPPQMESQA